MESPPYDAVIWCDPATSVEVESVAVPELKVWLPRLVLPSMNVTVPVGVPAVALTVAVN